MTPPSGEPVRGAVPPPGAVPDVVAAVDLGSNSFHMIVARTTGGEPAVVDRLREMVQLGYGLNKSRKLTAEAQSRALDCLRRFGQRVGHMPPESVRAVGTNTLRSAQNARDFVSEAEAALGHPIETISGIEEARLIYLGVTQTMADPGSRMLVVDIGGGSTELIVGDQRRPIDMESLYMGSLSMTRRFFSKGNLSPELWKEAELFALQELEGVRSRFQKLGWKLAMGASGTVRSIAAVVEAAGLEEGQGITLRSLKRLRNALLEAGNIDAADLPGLAPERRPIFSAGVVLLMSVFQALEIDRMQPAEGALREGLLYDLLGRFRDEDVRLRTVNALAERYHVDREHAGRVEQTALELLAQVAGDWKLTSPKIRQLVSWAARLHEIGLDIAHAHYHKHGEYIIAQSDLFGFSREEQQSLATLVRAHRRKFPVVSFRLLPRPWDRKAPRAAILLRLAFKLHRSRTPDPQPVPRLEIDRSRKTIRARFEPGWLADHPLTRADLETEQGLLAAAGFRLEVA
ncbi:MAG: exopolyphosphatase [Acidobacteriota bacterium]